MIIRFERSISGLSRSLGAALLACLVAGSLFAPAPAAAKPRLELHINPAIGYWPLDEGEGATAHDRSPRANHGAIVDAEWTRETPSKQGHALEFDGADSHVSVSEDEQIIPREGDWTVMGWLNLTGDGMANTFLQAGLGDDRDNRTLFYNREGELRLWSPTGGNVINAPGIANNGWRHVAFRRSGQSVKLYVDGELAGEGHAPEFVVGAGLKIGARPGDREMPFEGGISDMIIFDRALPEEQIVEFSASPADTAALVFDARAIQAAPGDSIHMTVKAVDEDGAPLTRGYRSVVTAESGALEPAAVDIAEGQSSAHFRWTHVEPGEYTITADHTELAAASIDVALEPTPPDIVVTSPDHFAGLLQPDEAFRFAIRGYAPVEPEDVTVELNGEDYSDQLEITGEPGEWEASLDGLPADKTYRARIAVRSEWGDAEHATDFKIFDNRIDGYRGIWWAHRPIVDSPEVPSYDWPYFKYSGPLSFAWGHTLTPMAVYAPEVDKTFFVYGGDTGPEDRYLMTMISYYDHENHRVPKPVIVRDQRGVDDPHDNPSVAIAEDGHVWVFLAGRSRRRPGQIFRSAEPYCINSFEQIIEREQTYSQIWPVPGEGFLHLLTLYTDGRELYWETHREGDEWAEEPADTLPKLVGFGGHYQVSRVDGQKVGTAFNYHPDGNVDRRTNLYYVQTTDFGETWTTVDGTPVETPLDEIHNPALIIDYEAQGKVAYPSKLLFDDDGHPVILYITSFGASPAPENDPRVWKITRWTGAEWRTTPITTSDHNYDMGSLYIDGDKWTLIAPALLGPQPYFTGGEVGVWSTTDPDREWWPIERRVTRDSLFNHCYLRRPHNPVEPFFAVWTDSDSSANSISRLYFTNSTGEKVYKLPYVMEDDYAEPVLLDPPVPPAPEETWPE